MALNDNAVLVIGAGNYFTAPVDTPLPADLLAPEVAWENVGHTSLEDIFAITSEGGEATTIQTLQNKALRTKRTARTDTVNIAIHQFDEAGLKLYFGSNAVPIKDDLDADIPGTLGVPLNPTPTTCAFLAVYVDGDNHFALYAPKAEIYRSEDVDPGDEETPATLPLGVKPLQSGTNPYALALTPLASA